MLKNIKNNIYVNNFNINHIYICCCKSEENNLFVGVLPLKLSKSYKIIGYMLEKLLNDFNLNPLNY